MPYSLNRYFHPFQLCQQLTPIPNTPESPTTENRWQPELIRTYNLPENPTSSTKPSFKRLHSNSGTARHDIARPHRANANVTGCLVSGKSYEQLIEEAVEDYLQHTAEPSQTIRDKVSERKAFLDGQQSGVFTFVPK